ncbi:histidine phosphatase family protein [Angustibacter peucedani]
MAASRQLLVVRHAKSDRDRPGPDHARPLNARGRRDAGALGRLLAGRGELDLVLCSSAVRARETWDLAAAALDPAPPLEVRDGLYLAPPSAVLAAVREVGDDVRALVVVGHEPTQSALVEQLAGTAEPVAAQVFADGFVTAAVATLTFEGAWGDVPLRECHLAAFDVPRG